MKFILLLSLFYVYLCSEMESEMEKECSHLKSEHKKICEQSFKAKIKIKMRSTVEAVVYSPSENRNTNNTTDKPNEIFHLKVPINTCKVEDCEFCCLSTNRCGTKEQCDNSKY